MEGGCNMANGLLKGNPQRRISKGKAKGMACALRQIFVAFVQRTHTKHSGFFITLSDAKDPKLKWHPQMTEEKERKCKTKTKQNKTFYTFVSFSLFFAVRLFGDFFSLQSYFSVRFCVVHASCSTITS